jgi:hypothetical protein
MPLPVQQSFALPNFTPDQISPVMTGIGQANALYQQSMQNQYLGANMQAALRKQQLANQISQAQANVAPQMTAADLAYKQAQTPNLNAATQYILSGQIPSAQAQAGYIGTEAAKNQFSINNPSTMLQGLPGQIGGLAVLRNMGMLSNGQVPQSSAPTQDQNFVNGMNNGVPMRAPAMPSAGAMTGGNQNGAPILPPNPYGTPQNPAAGVGQGNGDLSSFEGARNLLMQGITAPIQEKVAQANYYQSRASGFPFNSLPQNTKTYMIGQAAGMGIDPQDAIKAYYNGETISSLAQQRGLDPNNLPTPLYSATPQTVQLIQRRDQALNEINSIMPNITTAMAPYSRQFAGFSPSQISSAITNDNPDQQARFLASKALMPEMASLRLKAMGGNIGIEAIREVNNQSMGNIKSFQGLVSPKVYSAAQNYVDQWINQGADAANKVGLAGSVGNLNNGGQPISNATMTGAQTGGTPAGVGAMVSMKAPNGESFSIPAANVQAALKMGATQQ